MHKLVVLYLEPTDPDHFRDYYVRTHLPLVARMPGLLAWRYSFDVAAAQGQTPYFAVFAVFEAEFADVANYATGGAVVIHYPMQDGNS